jgi:diguanylate cyclase (GGDEF)-like protein/PAS domain S-box-containing protein
MDDVEALTRDLIEGRLGRIGELFMRAGARPPVAIWRPAPAEIRSPLLVRFQSRFEALRGGRPSVPLAAVRPQDYGPLGDYLIMLEAEAGGAALRYRYFGRQLSRHFDGDLTDLPVPSPTDHMWRFVHATYRAVLERCQPLYTDHEPRLGVLPTASQRLIQPLGDGDGPRGILVACDPEDPLLRIADIVPDAILMFDAAGRVWVLNPAAERLFGCGGGHLADLAVGDFLPLAFLREVLGGWPPPPLAGNVAARETAARGLDGRPLTLEVSIGELTGRGTRLFVAVIRDVSERRREEAEIRRLAFVDSLTGVANRLTFDERLRQALAGAGRARRKVALLLLDLDRFKSVNDTLGHRCGDLVLKAFAERLRPEIRETDTFARLGGDEFVLIQTDVQDAAGVLALAGRLLDQLATPIRVEDEAVALRASVGIALFPDHGRGAEGLLEAADRALYEAKRRGGGVAVVYARCMTGN